MKTLKNILILFGAIMITYSVSAQTQVAKLNNYEDRSDMVLDLMTNQYNEFENANEDDESIKHNEYVAMLNKSTRSNTYKKSKKSSNSDKLLKKDLNQVCDVQEYVNIDEYGSVLLTRDLVSSNVDYSKKYVSCRDKDSLIDANLKNIEVASITDSSKNNNRVLAMLEVENLESKVTDQFILTDNGEYLYKDGIELKGNEKIKEELSDGKPISELTFYYELADAGIIQDTLSAKEFTTMSVEEQSKLVSYNSSIK